MTTRASKIRPTAKSVGRTSRQLLTGLAAALLLLATVVGLPIALYEVAGVPWPHHTPSPGQLTRALTEPDTGQLFLAALLLVAWVAWAIFTLSVVVEAVALIRGRASTPLPGCAAPQQVAAGLLAAVAVLLLAAPQLTAHHAQQLPATPFATLAALSQPTRLDCAAIAVSVDGAPTRQPAASPAPAPAHAQRQPPTYVVRRGDTLWSIAEHYLGDPERWREIARLNYDRLQPDGRALTDSHWIYPGWRLHLPSDATGITAAAPNRAQPSTPPPSPGPDDGPTPTAPPDLTRPPTSPHGGQVAPEQAYAQPASSITLASGSEIGAAFAAGVLAALATARLRRRRAYLPSPPAPAPINADPPTAPEPLCQLTLASRVRDDDTVSDPMAPDRGPMLRPASDLPDGTVEIGVRDGSPVRLALTHWPGISIHGPRTDAAVRVWIAALVTHAGPYRVEVVTTRTTLHRLFGTAPALPALHTVSDGDTILTSLETEQLRRTRLLADADLPTVAELRATHPEDPLPVVVAILDTLEPDQAARWQLLMAAATRLDLAILLLDTDALGAASVHVDADATVATAEPEPLSQAVAGTRLFTLTTDEVQALLGPVVDAQTEAPIRPTDTDTPPSRGDDGDPSSAPAARSLSVPSTSRWPSRRTDDEEAPVVVRMFGPPTVYAWGRRIDVGLRESARELLAWYALHPDGAPADAAMAALWPDVPHDRGSQRFWTALGNLRSRLRRPDEDNLDILTKVGDHYWPDTDTLDIDVWRFQKALDLASEDPYAARGALTEAVDLYRGDFAGTASYPWVEPVREQLHRRALDAHVRLAELHDEAGDTEASIAVLERAVTLDPVAEEIYRRLIRALGRSGRRDSVNKLWSQLQDRLADIDLEPAPSTATLVHTVQKAQAAPVSR